MCKIFTVLELIERPSYFLTDLLVYSQGYRGGSPTAVQA